MVTDFLTSCLQEVKRFFLLFFWKKKPHVASRRDQNAGTNHGGFEQGISGRGLRNRSLSNGICGSERSVARIHDPTSYAHGS